MFAGQPARRALLLLWGWLIAAAVLAQPQSTTQFQLEIGMGHESQNSPLFQFSPESTIVYLDGVDHLSASHMRTGLHGSSDWIWSDGVMASFSADATLKRSAGTPDFDLSTLSLSPSIHWPVAGGASAGLGLSVDRLNVAGLHFRDTQGVQADWTLAKGGQLWGLVLETAVQRHPSDFSEMDAVASSLTFLSQTAHPFAGADSLDFSAIVGQERNLRGNHDLSNRNAMFSVLLHWTWLGGQWSAGHSWRNAAFEESLFPDEPIRQDRTRMLDLAVQWPLSHDQSIRFEVNESHNASNVHLYDNSYRQLSVVYQRSF